MKKTKKKLGFASKEGSHLDSFVLWKLEKSNNANLKNRSAHYGLLAFIDISIQAKELTNDLRTINSENTVVNQCIEPLI